MTFKDRLHKALSRSSTTTRSNSSASSTGGNNLATNNLNHIPTNTSSPLTPATTTSSRLSKRLTWRSDKSPTDKRAKKVEEWDDKWEVKPHKQESHEMLKGFEWKWKSSMDGRRSSGISGVSPMASRMGSMDSEHTPRLGSAGRRHSGTGPLERMRSNGEAVETVVEE